jgi:photosystem II stability/assembly factor-like uncharacterized protein
MSRLPIALWAVIVLAGLDVVAVACEVLLLAPGLAGVPALAHPAGTTSPGPAAPGSLPPMPGLLQGKYQAWAIAFPGRDTGIVAVAGYPGASMTVRSWLERTADGGRVWVAGRPASGQDQPGAQGGLAFASARQGWAYGPGLFYTRDGGATWRAERTPFPLTGPVAVAGTSTWVVGYACPSGDCPAAIYTTDRVGGALRRLPDQPAATGSVVAMQRPTPSVAWLLVAGPRGPARLVTTSDAGRSWAARPLPCPPGEQAGQLSATGPGSLWLVCDGTPQSQFTPEAVYRTVDGARAWTPMAAEDSLEVYPVSNRVAWATEGDPSDSIVVRTTDGGRTWHTVLSRASTVAEFVQAFAPQGPDGAQAVAWVGTAHGVRFVMYRTRDAGKTWQTTVLGT